MNNVAYKILSADEFAALQAGDFNGAPIDIADGYIQPLHRFAASRHGAKHFAGRNDLIIAKIDLNALGEKIRWEISRGDALFPHLYGRLEAADVLAAMPLVRRPDGSVDLP